MLSPELGLQLDIAARLVASAVLGGLIGFEREIHEHPAGMRTHLLVSLGAAVFTVLSIFAFELPPAPNGSIPTDPSRVAAQIVSGIGFLGAGAILKYGTTIRGLTTAASLWATAAVGMAAGTGAWLVAAVGTGIVVLSLWPLHAIIERARLQDNRVLRVRFLMADLEPLGRVTAELANRRIELTDVRTGRRRDGYEMELELRLPAGAVQAEVVQALGEIEGASLLDAERDERD